MRPDIPQKPGTSPSDNENRSPLVDNRESVTSEISRPSCNAAAMFGIAMSVGAGSLIAPAFQGVARANEPVHSQVSVSTSSTAEDETEIKSIEAVAPPQSIAAPVKIQASGAHAVQPGETLWQIAEAYQVEVHTLANANRLSAGSVLRVGQVLQLPRSAGVNSSSQSPVSLEEISQSVPEIPVLASSQSSELKSDIQTRQVATVSALRVQRERLKHSLAELGEESIAASEAIDQDELQLVEPAIAHEGDELPVTQFSNVPLPAIGGAAPPTTAATPETSLETDQFEMVPQAPDATSLESVDDAEIAPAAAASAPAETSPAADVAPEVSRQTDDEEQDEMQTVATLPQPLQQPDAKTNFDPTPLVNEIRALRNRYGNRQAPVVPNVSQQPQTSESPQVALVPKVEKTDVKSAIPKVEITRVEPVRNQSIAANPDFAGRKPDSALSIELRNFVQPKQKSEVKEKVAKSASPVETAKSAPQVEPVKVMPQEKPKVIARAAFGSNTYAPVAPAVKRMVAPNLPMIGNEDAFLPGGQTSRGYLWPAKGALTSGYGPRWGRMHRGIDIAAPTGTPIVASASGKVTYARWNNGGFGYLVEVEHEDGTMTRYAHNNRILVREGQQVAQGQQVSEMGSTGFSTGPHLHFEIHPRGRGAINPIAMLDRRS